MIVNIHEAKTHFSRLIQRAFSGEEVIIAKNGKPLLQLVPLADTPEERTPGLSRGKISLTEDFADPLPQEIIAEFER